MTTTQSIVTNLWFDTQAEEAAEYYCSIFPDARVISVTPYPQGTDNAGAAMVVEFELLGQRIVAINGGPQFTFSEAISLQILCDSQAEIDRYWELLSDGGSEGACGWCKDRYGLSWQIVPRGVDALFRGEPEARPAPRRRCSPWASSTSPRCTRPATASRSRASWWRA